MTPNSGYQSGMSTPEMPVRMGPYEPTKDHFSGMRKGLYCLLHFCNIICPVHLVYQFIFYNLITRHYSSWLTTWCNELCACGPSWRTVHV